MVRKEFLRCFWCKKKKKCFIKGRGQDLWSRKGRAKTARSRWGHSLRGRGAHRGGEKASFLKDFQLSQITYRILGPGVVKLRRWLSLWKGADRELGGPAGKPPSVPGAVAGLQAARTFNLTSASFSL